MTAFWVIIWHSLGVLQSISLCYHLEEEGCMGLEGVSRTEDFLESNSGIWVSSLHYQCYPKTGWQFISGLHSGSLPERQIHCHFWKRRVNPRAELAITKVAELALLRYATRRQFAFHYVCTQSVWHTSGKKWLLKSEVWLLSELQKLQLTLLTLYTPHKIPFSIKADGICQKGILQLWCPPRLSLLLLLK